MNRLLILATGCFALTGRLAWAQETNSADALPSGPLIVAGAPDFAQWTIDFTYSDAPKPGEPSRLDIYKQAALKDPALAKSMQDPTFVFSIQNIRPVHVLVTKTGNLRHEERTFEQGYKGEMWATTDAMVERKPMVPDLVATNVAGTATSEFSEFDWISKANFVGIQSQGGRKCMAFKEDVYDADHKLIGTKHALVDLKTRYPVTYQFDVETSNYTFLTPPTAMQTMPEDYLAAAKRMLERIRKATPHLGAP